MQNTHIKLQAHIFAQKAQTSTPENITQQITNITHKHIKQTTGTKRTHKQHIQRLAEKHKRAHTKILSK